MTLQIGSDVGPYTVLRTARRQARHARSERSSRPPRVWLAEPFAGGAPVALITGDIAAADTVGTAADGRSPDPTDDPSAPLRREWALVGSLRHPHLASVQDLLDTPEGAVLVTAWADRGSVHDLLAGHGRLSAGQTVTLLAGVCAALTACHERGIVHGDVTPGTVLVDADGRPLLARVGRTTAAVDCGRDPSVDPRCASPDVARGRVATVVDDVFSTGAVAMQCLTGRAAWPAQDLRDVVIQSEFGQWPQVPESDGAGPELTALVNEMLAADPTARPTVREVAQRLSRCGPPLPLPAVLPEPGPGRRGRHAEPAAPVDPAIADAACWTPGPAPGEHRVDDDRVVDDRAGGTVGVRQVWQLWRRAVLPTLLLVVVAAAAIAVGVWWAGTERLVTAALPADPAPVASAAADEPAPGAARESVTGGTDRDAPDVRAESAADDPSGLPPPDWPAVVNMLDERRAAAFAAGDPAMLQQVYTATAPGLAVDAARIRALADSGLRIDGLRHQVSAVVASTPPDGTADRPVLEVTDTLPAVPVENAAGEVVSTTAPATDTRRVLVLELVGSEFRIASVTGVTG